MRPRSARCCAAVGALAVAWVMLMPEPSYAAKRSSGRARKSGSARKNKVAEGDIVSLQDTEKLSSLTPEQVSAAMEKYIDVPEEQIVGFWTLTKQAEEYGHKGVAAVDGADRVVAAMERHPFDLNVATKGCRAVAVLAKEHTQALLRLDTINITITLLNIWQSEEYHDKEEHPDAELVQAECSRVLANLINAEPYNIEQAKKKGKKAPSQGSYVKKIVSLGGLEAVLEGAKAWPDSRPVQEQTLGALSNLVRGAKSSSRILIEGGGVKHALEVMEEHSDSVAALTAGCGLLRNLAADSADDVGSAGGVGGAVAAMTAHPGSSGIAVRPSPPCLVHKSASETRGAGVGRRSASRRCGTSRTRPKPGRRLCLRRGATRRPRHRSRSSRRTTATSRR